MMGDTYISAQRSVLGSLLIDPEHTAGLIFAGSCEEDFAASELRSLYRAARELFFADRPIDPVVLCSTLGDAYTELIAELMRETPTAAHIEYYLEILHSQAQLARVRGIAEELQYEFSDVERCRELVGQASLALSDDAGHDSAIPIGEIMSGFFDRHVPDRKKTYFRWGYELLDKHLFTEPGDFVILGGYPSAGKSIMSVQIALTAARAGYRVGYFSLETDPRTKIADRVMAHAARVPLPKIKHDDFNEADSAALVAAGEELRKLPVEFFPAGGYSLADVQAKTLSKRYQVILIDYLQLIRAPGKDLREQITAVSIGLHTLAQKHGVIVIALSQLSRPEKSEGKPKRPTMASLRESGQLEQDADAVLLLYNETPDDRNGQRRLQIAKNKEGTVDSCLLDFEGALQTLRDPKKTWKDFPHKPVGKVNPEYKAKLEKQAEESLQVKLEELDGDEGPLPF